MTLPASAVKAQTDFAACAGWEQRARLLLHWGNQLIPLQDTERCAANQVQGCESQVWLVADPGPHGLSFRADSDARLLRGLLAVVLARVNELPAEELATLDIAEWLQQLGLSRQLSPSRGNGLNAVLQRMRALANA